MIYQNQFKSKLTVVSTFASPHEITLQPKLDKECVCFNPPLTDNQNIKKEGQHPITRNLSNRHNQRELRTPSKDF